MRRAFLFLLTLIVLGANGCDRSPRSAGGGGREVICNLDGVRTTLVTPRHTFSWDLSVSPGGQHVAVKRTGLRSNKSRYDVDGAAGQEFDIVDGGVWSADGSTHLYVATNKTAMAARELVVHRGATYGPYFKVGRLVVSDNGNRWAAFNRELRPSDDPLLHILVVDGQPRPLTQTDLRMDTLQFDKGIGEFICQSGEKWISLRDEKVVKAPSAAAPALPALPAGVSVQLNKVRREYPPEPGHSEPQFRHRFQLTVNSKTIGEFDWVPGGAQSATWQAGFPQSDGTILFYAVDGNELLRLRVMP